MKLALLALLLIASAALGGEPLTVVSRYEEFAAHGLKADVFYNKGKVMALGVESVDPAKRLPDWMQAFYVAKRDAETAQPLYSFDMNKPNRVGAFFGWSETDADLVLIIGPRLRDGQTFKGKQYLAIAVKDLISWRGNTARK